MTFLEGMEKAINLLLQKMKHLTVLSIPPIPRLAATNESEHLKALNSYNVIIRGLVTQNMASMKFIDLVPLFLGKNGIRMELYKKDQLHFSDEGLEVLVQTLHSALAMKCCQSNDNPMN
ncbi:Isoamyl acetate-hydrolyzing esterase 1-like protein [Frankliniella fusca]|uniref:Isoamyl acetate-hydrolyzing esterase 1-like protein n=1 Tax=Frankliniella fusca TaxID=407009 RepID=A0AAE1LKT5_9NEOP|nr:Isoamyl acetate-hydrolyzing esterase 1-like protein [Frankliniella fusca]